MSYNQWLYVYSNPVNLVDPTGMYPNKSNSGNEIIKYIAQRIREDSKSSEIKKIHELNNTHYYEDACDLYNNMSWWERTSVGGGDFLNNALYADAGARAAATFQFGCLVADARSRPTCGRWDYKREISAKWGVAQTVDFSAIGDKRKVIFYYDIWANIHFGYLGMIGGFSEEALQSGAAIENAASNLKTNIQDDPSDTMAIFIGISMYKLNNASELSILAWLYAEQSKLNKAVVDESGNVIRIYR